jgi:periplasmic copper chaperone A
MRIAIAASLAAGLALAGAAAAQTAAQTGPAAGKIAIVAPWARATPGIARTGAVYLTIRSPAADRLVSVSTPVAAAAEPHAMEMHGMVMRMRELRSVSIPPGRPVSFAPGGMHIMLIGLKAPLRQGASFPLTLDFAKAGAETVTVRVGAIAAMGPPH